MALGFGLLSAQRTAGDARSWEDRYDETLELAAHLERVGYSSVWTTEHHFVDDGYMPSLLVTSAAIAARTSTIEIGTGLVLAPLHEPLRLAEDAATVQAIAKGRLVLGLGLGWSTTEFAALGVDLTQRGKAMTETLQILPMAWTGEPFTWDGDIYRYPELAVRPAAERTIPIVIGGGVDAAVRRAARLADGFFSNASPTRFAEQVRVAHEEMERIGRDPQTFRWIYYAMMYPGPVDDIIDAAWHLTWKYADMEASAARSGLAPTPPLDDDMRPRIANRVIGGSPTAILDTLAHMRAEAGVPVEWVARSYFPEVPYTRQVEIIDELGSQVLPFAPTG